MRFAWTLVATSLLGLPLASAHPVSSPTLGEEALAVDSGSRRGVAQDYLVAPSGGELTGQTRFVTADPLLGDQRLAFSDLALFDLAARYSVFSRLELSGRVTLLPKQPSYTEEKVWQSVAVGARSPIGNHAAIALTGEGGHLLGHDGSWVRENLTLELRKPVHEILTFDVQGGVDSIALLRHDHDGGSLAELGVETSALLRDPHGNVGGWVGIGYAYPLRARGNDPTTDMRLDPQPRLDFRIGGVLSLVKNWDVFAEYRVIDRGELGNAATRLPILDGGFDQRQLILGVTRHVEGKPSGDRYDRGRDDDQIPLALR